MKAKLVAIFRFIYSKIVEFLGPVATSVRGKINIDEFIRIIILAASTGGSFYGFIMVVYENASLFVTDSTLTQEISLAVSIITFLVDYFRRKNHGKSPK